MAGLLSLHIGRRLLLRTTTASASTSTTNTCLTNTLPSVHYTLSLLSIPSTHVRNTHTSSTTIPTHLTNHTCDGVSSTSTPSSKPTQTTTTTTQTGLRLYTTHNSSHNSIHTLTLPTQLSIKTNQPFSTCTSTLFINNNNNNNATTTLHTTPNPTIATTTPVEQFSSLLNNTNNTINTDQTTSITNNNNNYNNINTKRTKYDYEDDDMLMEEGFDSFDEDKKPTKGVRKILSKSQRKKPFAGDVIRELKKNMNSNIKDRRVMTVNHPEPELRNVTTTLFKALHSAQSRSKDLFKVATQVDDHGEPYAVCRQVTLKQLVAEHSDKASKQANKEKGSGSTKTKAIKFSHVIAEGDVVYRVEKIRKLLDQGYSVNVIVFFKQRWSYDEELGFALLENIVERLDDIGAPESTPRADSGACTVECWMRKQPSEAQRLSWPQKFADLAAQRQQRREKAAEQEQLEIAERAEHDARRKR